MDRARPVLISARGAKLIGPSRISLPSGTTSIRAADIPGQGIIATVRSEADETTVLHLLDVHGEPLAAYPIEGLNGAFVTDVAVQGRQLCLGVSQNRSQLYRSRSGWICGDAATLLRPFDDNGRAEGRPAFE